MTTNQEPGSLDSDALEDMTLPGSPTILVADDEELMREVVCIMIEEAGGETIEAKDGAEAVQLFEENAKDVSCVFLDFSMPGLNGYQVFQQIRKLDDSIPIVMMSGLKIAPEVEVLWRNKEIEFINKPFREEVLLGLLAKKIRERNEIVSS